ncbi:MAG: S-layer homology domain-containing protein, partial [Anaerotignaceae bacterium]
MKKGAFIKRVFALIMTVTLATGFVPLDLIGTKEVYAAGFNMGKINHWAEESMRKLYDLGLLSGDTNGNMNPDKNITRAEFVSLINRAFGYKQTGSKTPFTDVKGTEWYAQDINIAYTQGYFSGDGKSSANATGNLSREQAVTLLGRNLHIEEDAQLTGKFTDEQTIQNWSRGYINTASDKNIVSGYSNGEFRPSANITRAEAATMISNS